MIKEFSNPTLLDEQVDQENFVDIMCKNYTDEQIIEQLYKTNLIKNLIDIKTINQFTIQPKVKENLEIVSNESVNTVNEEKKFVNVKNEIIRYNKSYSKPKGPQWKPIQGCKYFSQLDYKSGFWQIRLEEDSKPWTTFSCPCGLYEWNVMSFGLKKCYSDIPTNDG